MIDNMIQAMDHWAVTEPNRLAYDDLGHTNTYRELKQRSDALAAHLDHMQLPAGSPIMVFGGQTFDMMVTFLGVVKSGHAYVPIDTHSPLERVTTINEIAQPAAAIGVADLPTTLGNTPIITAADLQRIWATPVAYDVTHAVQGDETYYIIFTSGTTGKPKGVQISHNNLLSYVNWMLSDDFALPTAARTLSQAPYSFDLSVMDWGPTLASGGTLVALPKTVTDNFKQLFETLPTMDLNVWVSTPSFMDICLLEPTFDGEHYPELTRFLFCGEELTHATASALHQRFPAARIFNTYGPTETTVAVTQVEITAQLLQDYPRLPIGYVKADTTIQVVDEQLQPVPAGSEGELLISGPSMSKGYLNNPEKTAKAFVTLNGHQVYRSGDLGVQLPNGLIMYRGRTDFQIKLHGYRIELEEVNHYLSQEDHIQVGVAVPRYDRNHKVSQLIAWVVPNAQTFSSELALTKAIKDNLQGGDMMEYMIPQRFVYKDSLPMTPNGKVDIKSIIAEVNQ
ncbi:D-alanine--poly(phosphoribitol) ligase subunit DltA [Levilactobacillus brevis]|uniref:D-alanine--poly(phosphoribitol) ligase subunit DltA n=1 Tax=Levilactobacillus brevis TaxID=1580 RepID=UPI001BA56462|nr:D-alanine--poly(phosphoribitol) ligase subunit DltA [Levilactobacillus brevis]MBS1004922.1 D-alanine--poly(phosphoribitol) ligase subunit DltA [Levilactobacillus brevis]MBS1012457.1 D-alanine--poly(phosphoribitol) ligase subunit DltA [Levilactobacillus brevis]